MESLGASSTPARSRSIVIACALALPLLYAAQIRFSVSHLDPDAFQAEVFPPLGALALWLLAAVQGGALYALYVGLRARPGGVGVAAVLVCASAMLAISLATAQVTSGDPLAYIGYAKARTFADAYRPLTAPFSGAFAPITAAWGAPLPPCVYGPLWLALDRLLVAPVQSIHEGFFALRAINVVALGALLAGLWAAGFGLEILALVALNPALHLAFIVGMHNDLQALALFSLGLAAAVKRLWPLAVAFVVAAASVKISFVLVGLMAFAGAASRRTRLLAACAVVALTFGVALVFGGTAYLHAMTGVGATSYAAASGHAHGFAGLLVHVACVAICVAAVAAAVLLDRQLPSATWSFWTISVAWFDWYISWCLPYALRTRGYEAMFLALWPLAAMTIRHPLPHVNPMYLVVAYVAYELYARMSGRRPSAEWAPR